MNINNLNILIEEYKFINDDINLEKERMDKMNMRLQEIENKKEYGNIKITIKRSITRIEDNLIESNYFLDVIKDQMKREIDKN